MITIDPGKVRARRLAAGFRKVRPAAQAAEVNWKTIKAYENPDLAPAVPRLPTLQKLAAAYGCNIRDFAQDPHAVDALVEALTTSPDHNVPSAPA